MRTSAPTASTDWLRPRSVRKSHIDSPRGPFAKTGLFFHMALGGCSLKPARGNAPVCRLEIERESEERVGSVFLPLSAFVQELSIPVRYAVLDDPQLTLGQEA